MNYLYTFTLTYTGPDPFLNVLMDRFTRGTGALTLSQVMTQAQATNLRAQALAAGFAFSNISRVPVQVPEVVA